MAEARGGGSESLSFASPRASPVKAALLRAGYAALGIAFAAIAASVYVPFLLIPGLFVALVGGFLLAFSGDDLPKWAGIVILVYFALTVLVFLAATPVTINKGGRFFVNATPTRIAQDAVYWLGLAAPLMLAAAAVLSVWERETAPRVLLFGAIGGFVVVGLLSAILVPADLSADAARQQGDLVKGLFAVSAAAGAAGALWAAGRADEYG